MTSAFPPAEKGRVHITALKAMQIQGPHSQSLIKVETDAGLFGIGEAGASGPMARAYLKHVEPLLIGQDPLEIDRLFNAMTSLTHPYMAHIPTISGVDIALWDLAGKILQRSVSDLLNGRYREWIPLYTNTPGPQDWFDPVTCQDWADSLRAHPIGWQTVKFGFERLRGKQLPAERFVTGRPATMLKTHELRLIGKGYENCRKVLGPEIDFIVHCHNEWDLASAQGLAEAVAPTQPLWIEDPLPVAFSQSWVTLKQSAPVRIKTGEKLELTRGFLPFLVHNAVDVIHPDIVFAGGLTGLRRIAELADLYYTPVVCHNIGSAVHNVATAHFGATTRNFVMSETRLGTDAYIQEMVEEPLQVQDSALKVPDGPGLGITLRPDVLRAHLLPGEPFWDD